MSILTDALIDAKANLCWNHQQQQLKKEVEIDCICTQLADMIYLTRQEIAKEIENTKVTFARLESSAQIHSNNECRIYREHDLDTFRRFCGIIARGHK